MLDNRFGVREQKGIRNFRTMAPNPVCEVVALRAQRVRDAQDYPQQGPCALFGHRFTVARNWSFRQRPCGGHDRAGLSIPAADIMKRGSDLRKTARARMPGAGVTTDRDR